MVDAEQERSGPPDDDWRRQYWRRNLRLMIVLLAIWFVVSFGCGILLVEPLNQIVIGGFPLGFWFAQQGSIYVFLLLILVYALSMDRLDKQFGVEEREDDGLAASAAASASESSEKSAEDSEKKEGGQA